MKILVVTHSFWPHHAGIETVAFEQGRRLVKRGHEICVVTGRRGAEPLEETVEGMRVHRVPTFNPLWGFGPPYLLFDSSIHQLLEEKARWCDVIYAHGHPYLSTFFAACAAKRHRKPFFLMQHNTFLDYGLVLNFFEWLNDRAIGRYSLAAARKVLCVSKATEAYVKQVCPQTDTLVLYNGVDMERFKPAKDKAIFRKGLRLQPSKFLVLTVRELAFKNGLDLLVEAASLLQGRPEILFLVAGKGPDRKKIEGLVAARGLSNVRLLGFIDDEALPSYYQAVDVFMLPSRTGEGFPMVILEALASGLPVIATDTGGQRELLVDGQAGRLVPPSGKALAAATIEAMASRSGSASAEKVFKRQPAISDWKTNVDALEALFHQA